MYNKIYKSYIIGTIFYGVIRKLPQMQIATTNKYNKIKKEYHKVPMLISDKILVIGICSIMTPYVWPYYLYKDITKIKIVNYKKYDFYKEDDACYYIYS